MIKSFTNVFNSFVVIIQHNFEEVSANLASLTPSTTKTRPPIQLFHRIYQLDVVLSNYERTQTNSCHSMEEKHKNFEQLL